MPHNDPTIEARYKQDDSDRRGSLDAARLAAALSKPWVLPPDGQSANDKLPRNFQSVGSRGITNLVGRLLLALYPPNIPWFVFVPTPEFLNDPQSNPQVVQAFQQQLFLYGRVLTAQLEQLEIDPEDDRGQFLGFRSHKRKTLEQILITGDALERIDDEYRMTLFRRDRYVTARDSSGRVLYHITRERKDPLELDEQRLALANIPAEQLKAIVKERIQDLYTLVEFQPQSNTWDVVQEMNGNVINQVEEKISPYISTPFELTGEDYGRGFIEQNLGDLRSLDELSLKRLDMLAMAAKQLIAVDGSSTVSNQSLAQESGNVIRGAVVRGGKVEDIATVGFQDVRDYQMMIEGIRDIRSDLFKAFLTESETTRNAERVTTAEIRRNVFEIESALGGVYASVADEQQRPLIRRVVHQYNGEKKFEMPRLASGSPAQHVKITTGLTALAEESEADKLLSALQILQVLGEGALQRIDMGVAVDVALRQIGFHEPGLIRTDEQIAREQAQAQRQQIEMAAAGQAIESAGAIAENQASIAPRRPPAEATTPAAA
jgi:hypothetical protein